MSSQKTIPIDASPPKAGVAISVRKPKVCELRWRSQSRFANQRFANCVGEANLGSQTFRFANCVGEANLGSQTFRFVNCVGEANLGSQTFRFVNCVGEANLVF